MQESQTLSCSNCDLDPYFPRKRINGRTPWSSQKPKISTDKYEWSSLNLHLRISYFQRDGFPSFPWARIHIQEASLSPPSKIPIISQDLDDSVVLKSSLLPALYHTSSKTILDLAKWTLIEKIHLQNDINPTAETRNHTCRESTNF